MTLDPADIAINRAAALVFLRRAVKTNSVTGNEGQFAQLLADELHDVGADEVHLHEVEPGRPLVWSLTKGSEEHPTILLAAHLDTVAVSAPPPEWEGTERADGLAAAIVDDALWGTGAADAKGGLATATAALRTLRSRGQRPRGNLVVLGIPDEESGIPELGRSVGMHAAVELINAGVIPRPDFAIYLEPTNLAIYTAQIGFLVAHVTVHGHSAYFAHADQGIDPLPAGNRILAELLHHNEQLSKRERDPVLGAPRLVVWKVRAGGVIAVAKTCELDLIRIVLPSERLEDAAADIEDAVRRATGDGDVRVTVTFPGGRDHQLGGLPACTDADHPEIGALLAAMRRVVPDRARCSAAPWWSEISFVTALGIPGVYWAGGDISHCHTNMEHLPLGDFWAAVEVLSGFLAGGEQDGDAGSDAADGVLKT